jgi:hypothetical protein
VLKIDDLIERFNFGASGDIIKTQTTYLDAVCSFQDELLSPETFRIHFRGKREFSLGKGKFTSLKLLENHPLLLEYIEPIVAVQLVSPVNDKEMFRRELELAANQVFDGWRSVEHYNFMSLDKFLAESYGILMEAPKSYAEAALQAGERSGVKLTLRERYEPKGKLPHVLLLDEWYIVADDFTVERV